MDVDPSNTIDLSIFAGLQGRMWLIENQCKCFVEPLFKKRSSVWDLLFFKNHEKQFAWHLMFDGTTIF